MDMFKVQPPAVSAYCFFLLSDLWAERLGALVIPLNAWRCSDVVPGCDLPSICIVVCPCAGVGRAFQLHTEATKGAPGPLVWRASLQSTDLQDGEEGSLHAFWHARPSAMETNTREGVSVTVLLPLHAAVEGCNNKTQANV